MKTLKRSKAEKATKNFKALKANELLQIKGGEDGPATLRDGIIR
jgi:hypothetical protein